VRGSREEIETRFAQLRRVVRHLEARNGEPDGRLLFEYRDGLLCAVVTLDGFEDWTITYYIATDGRMLLLTVFLAASGNDLQPYQEIRAELEKAVELMERAKRHHDDVGEI
jgi:hypothetical protein